MFRSPAGIGEPDHAAGDRLREALAIIGPVHPRRLHVVRDEAALDQNGRQDVLLDDHESCPLHSAVSGLITWASRTTSESDHRGEQDVLRVVIVAGQLLDIAAGQVSRMRPR